MSIKNDENYPKYILYLESKNLSNGGFALSKISAELFNQFLNRYKNNPIFQENLNNKFRSIDRQERIETIIDEDFDLFIEEMGNEVKIQKNTDNFFDF